MSVHLTLDGSEPPRIRLFVLDIESLHSQKTLVVNFVVAYMVIICFENKLLISERKIGVFTYK